MMKTNAKRNEKKIHKDCGMITLLLLALSYIALLIELIYVFFFFFFKNIVTQAC